MKGLKCACGKMADYDKNLKFNGVNIDGWVCKSCGETYYNPEKAEKILLLNKLKKMKYHLKLNKVKSNLIVRIPKEVGEALNLDDGNEVELALEGSSKMVMQRVAK
jgi:hypothetical protein